MRTSTQRNVGGAIDWLETEGGPFVVLAVETAGKWGVPDGDVSAFERSLEVDDYLGLTEFDGGHALVLGDDPYPTALLAAPRFGGVYIIRRLWGEDVEDAIDAVHEIRAHEWSPEGVVFDAMDGRIVLFDSVRDPFAARHRISLSIAPGRYAIETADLQPDDDLCVMVHRLVPMS